MTAERGGRLVQLAMPGGRVARSVSTTGDPHNLGVDPRQGELWVTIDGSAAAEVRSRSGRLVARPRLGGAPHDLTFVPGARRLWLSNWLSNTLSVVSVERRRRVGSLVAGAEPHHFAFGLGCLWVSDNGNAAVLRIEHHVAVAGTNILVAVNGTGRVAVLSRRGRLSRQVDVGAGPHGIAAVRLDGSAERRRTCR